MVELLNFSKGEWLHDPKLLDRLFINLLYLVPDKQFGMFHVTLHYVISAMTFISGFYLLQHVLVITLRMAERSAGGWLLNSVTKKQSRKHS